MSSLEEAQAFDIKEREEYLKDIENFTTYFVLSFNKLQRLSDKEKVKVIKEHIVLREELIFKEIIKDIWNDIRERNVSVWVIALLPVTYLWLVLTNHTVRKFKDANAELYI